MKTLYCVRHAKSSWKFPRLTDFERPLNKRGLRDAPYMGRLMYDLGYRPDIIISSPATRALSTAQLMAENLRISSSDIIEAPQLYHAADDEFYHVIHNIAQSAKSAMIVSHNPGLTEFVNALANAEFPNVPTGGIVGIDCDVSHWRDIRDGAGKLQCVEFPRTYFPKKVT